MPASRLHGYSARTLKYYFSQSFVVIGAQLSSRLKNKKREAYKACTFCGEVTAGPTRY